MAGTFGKPQWLVSRNVSVEPCSYEQAPRSQMLFIQSGVPPHAGLKYAYLPEEVERQHHLQRGGPDHVDVSDEVHEALSVHRHQVDDLSHRGGAARLAAYHQGLKEQSQTADSTAKPDRGTDGARTGC